MAAGSAVAVAEEEGEAGAEGVIDATPRKGKRKKLIIIVAGVVLLLAAVAGGLFFTGIVGGKKKTDEAAAATAPPKAEPGTGVYVDLPEILVNLEAVGKQQRYLKTSISLEVADPKQADALKKVLPRLIDQFQTYLRGLRVDDLQGSAGVYRLRQELLARVAQAAEPVPVTDVLFRELLVQ